MVKMKEKYEEACSKVNKAIFSVYNHQKIVVDTVVDTIVAPISKDVVGRKIDAYSFNDNEGLLMRHGAYCFKAGMIDISQDLIISAFRDNMDSMTTLLNVIFHECRHAWQHKNGWDFTDYVVPSLEDSYFDFVEKRSANLKHRAEVDANDFAEKKLASMTEKDYMDLFQSVIDIVEALYL